MKRKGVWAAATILPIVIAAMNLPRLFAILLCGAALILLLTGCLLRRKKWRKTLLFVSVCAFLALFSTFLFQTVSLGSVKRLENEPVKAQVLFRERYGSGWIVTFSEAVCNEQSVRIPGKILLQVYDTTSEPFHSAQGTFRLSPVEPSDTDLLSRGITGTAEAEQLSDPQDKPLPFSALLEKLRRSVRTYVAVSVGGEEGELAASLLTGDKSSLSESTRIQFSRCGLSHIMAVSGLHLSVILSFLSSILYRLPLPRSLTLFLSFLAVGMVMLLAGFSPSVQRAGIMAMIALLGDLFLKPIDSLNSLALSLALMALLSPVCIYSLGYWLSGAATLGIVLLNPIFDGYAARFFRPFTWKRSACSVLFTTVSASVFTLPILLFFFGELSLVTMPAMFCANIPVTGALTGIVLLCLLGWIPFLRAFASFAIRFFCQALLEIADFFSGFPASTIALDLLPLLVGILFAALGVLLWKKKLLSSGWRKAAQAACFALTVCFLVVSLGFFKPRNLLSVYDTGSSAASVVLTEDSALVINCPSSAAASEISNLLHSHGLYRIRALIFSGSSAKQFKGAPALLEYLPADRIYLPAATRRQPSLSAFFGMAQERESEMIFYSVSGFYREEEISFSLDQSSEAVWLDIKGRESILFLGEGTSSDLSLFPYPADILVLSEKNARELDRRSLQKLRTQSLIVTSSPRLRTRPTDADLKKLLPDSASFYRTAKTASATLAIGESS